MSDTRPDQTEEILSYEISDEALESAAGTKRAARYTLYYCTALDLCPVPSHCALNSATHLLASCKSVRKETDRCCEQATVPFLSKSGTGKLGAISARIARMHFASTDPSRLCVRSNGVYPATYAEL